MKKGILIAIVIIVLIIIGIFIFSFNNGERGDAGQEEISGEQPIQEYANLQTDEDIFNTIDENLGFLD